MTDWRTNAACIEIGPGLFESNETRVEARQFCRTNCSVMQECLEAALAAEGSLRREDRFGVFGGEYAMTRAKIARQRAAAA